VETDKDAPNGRVVLVDPMNPDPKNWQDVLPERSEPLQSVETAGGKLFASWRKDVATRTYVFDLTGKLENEITLPGLGTASGFRGLSDDKYVFYSFTSFNFPSTTYKYDIATKKSSVFHKIDIPGFNPNAYETKQVFFNSKDGTRVPMFLVYKKGITLDGNNPTVLYGYGGFNIVTEPNFNSLRLALLEQVKAVGIADRVRGAAAQRPLVEHRRAVRAQIDRGGQALEHRRRSGVEMIALVGQVRDPAIACGFAVHAHLFGPKRTNRTANSKPGGGDYPGGVAGCRPAPPSVEWQPQSH
jgi:hypothetical protein